MIIIIIATVALSKADTSSDGIVVYVGSGFAALVFIIIVVVVLTVITVTIARVRKKKIDENGTYILGTWICIDQCML